LELRWVISTAVSWRASFEGLAHLTGYENYADYCRAGRRPSMLAQGLGQRRRPPRQGQGAPRGSVPDLAPERPGPAGSCLRLGAVSCWHEELEHVAYGLVDRPRGRPKKTSPGPGPRPSQDHLCPFNT